MENAKIQKNLNKKAFLCHYNNKRTVSLHSLTQALSHHARNLALYHLADL